MMKNLLFLVLLVNVSNLFAQPNTNIYLFDIVNPEEKLSFENLRVISNRSYYDNQPSFYDNNTVLFVATRNEQTDIAKYDIARDIPAWITNTPLGSEYSPKRIPNSEDISAIRLDTTGLQRLYRYDSETNEPILLIEKLKVGYHEWDNQEQLLTAVLVKEGMNLMLNYIPESKSNTIAENIGRSLHKIPNSDLMSFVSSSKEALMVSSYDPKSSAIKDLVNLPMDSKDICWLDEKSVLVPNGKKIMLVSTDKNKEMSMLHEFKEKEIYNISIMTISPDGKHIAIVSDENPEIIVDKQLETFNAGDLNGFVSCFSDTVSVQNFPKDFLYKGRTELKNNYGRHMDENLSTRFEVINRMVMDNIVIDEEVVRENEEDYHQAAIYEVTQGSISKMTLIHEKQKNIEVEKIVDLRLRAYNNRNLNAFINTFSEDVEVFNYPNKTVSKGKEALLEKYTTFFKKATDLECDVKKRIIVGNKIIDEEVIRIGSNTYRTIAIYEVVDDLIKKVTFIR